MLLFAAMAIVGALATVAVVGRGDTSLLDSRALLSAASLLVVGSLACVYLAVWELNARLLVGPDHFGYRDILGRTRTWNASEVDAVIDVAIDYAKFSEPRRAVFVLGVDGRRLMAINPIAWPSTACNRIARAAGKPIHRRRESMTAKAFRREYPRAMSWASTHPNLMGTLLGLVLISLPLAVVIGAGWLRRP